MNAIHWTHRFGALVTFVTLIYVAHRTRQARNLRGISALMLALLMVQVTLGIVNVLGSLPLPVAVAHNGVAGLLLVVLVMLHFATRSPSRSSLFGN